MNQPRPGAPCFTPVMRRHGGRCSGLAVLVLMALAAPASAAGDASTLRGALMVGYQGWFNAEGDGAGLGWNHWTRDGRTPSPANIRVDLWPDLSEYGPDERFATAFTTREGRPAELFSSHRRETVERHFRWMREYGIDGAFLQRFPSGLRNENKRRHLDTVLTNAFSAATREGRTFALMYDLSGLPGERFAEVREDWLRLDEGRRLTSPPAYLRHRGRPLVAVWGVGFSDGRPYSVAECAGLVAFFHERGCSVMLGVPCYWRTLNRDAVADPALHNLLGSVEVISPWTVGRYATPEKAGSYARETLAGDLAWCRNKGVDLLPVAFPGFSWHNMKPDAPSNQIPRRRGAFFGAQLDAQRATGAGMQYVAMFDEVDEATAIFKCSDQPPEGASFVTMEGLPADHYLRMAGEAADRLKNPSP